MKLLLWLIFYMLTASSAGALLFSKGEEPASKTEDSALPIDTISLSKSMFPFSTFKELDSISKQLLIDPSKIDRKYFVNDSIYYRQHGVIIQEYVNNLSANNDWSNSRLTVIAACQDKDIMHYFYSVLLTKNNSSARINFEYINREWKIRDLYIRDKDEYLNN